MCFFLVTDCDECRSLFQERSGVCIAGPSFILDSPTDMAVPQRALLTLPHGLMIGRSSVPDAGLGVMNQGPAVTPGMHFGPVEGEATSREEAMASRCSWEVKLGEKKTHHLRFLTSQVGVCPPRCSMLDRSAYQPTQWTVATGRLIYPPYF